MMKDFCMPAKVYVVLTIIGIISSIPFNFQLGISNVVLSIIVGLITAVLFTWVIDIVCRYLSVGFAWFLVLGLPIVMMLIIVLGFFSIVNSISPVQKKHHNRRNIRRY